MFVQFVSSDFLLPVADGTPQAEGALFQSFPKFSDVYGRQLCVDLFGNYVRFFSRRPQHKINLYEFICIP